MALILITGSTEGLGLAAARSLIADGHEVVMHARTRHRAAETIPWAQDRGRLVIGDLARADDVGALAEQIAAIGRMDAVIHNAGIYLRPTRDATPEGHARILAVNTLAPYLITATIERPDRLIFLSSAMHRDGSGSLPDIDWVVRDWDAGQAYCESKLHVAALAMALARRWPRVSSNAVDPGWVPTRMGGADAPDDFAQGYLTQTWLATSTEPAARHSGGYWHHRQRQRPSELVLSELFQDELLEVLEDLTGVALP